MTSRPLSPEWRGLADRVVAEYRAAVGDDLVAIALFGSVARGRARPDSDLDLYVVTRRPSLGDSRLHGMWDRIDASPEYQAFVRAGYQPTPSPVPHSVDDLVRHPWILLDIAHHGVILHDPAAILERELDAAGLGPARRARSPLRRKPAQAIAEDTVGHAVSPRSGRGLSRA